MAGEGKYAVEAMEPEDIAREIDCRFCRPRRPKRIFSRAWFVIRASGLVTKSFPVCVECGVAIQERYVRKVANEQAT